MRKTIAKRLTESKVSYLRLSGALPALTFYFLTNFHICNITFWKHDYR